MIGRTAAMQELALHHFQMGLSPTINQYRNFRRKNTAGPFQIKSKPIYLATKVHDKIGLIRPRPTNSTVATPLISRTNRSPALTPTDQIIISPIIIPTPPHQNPGHTLEQCRKREFNNNLYKNFDRNQSGTSQRVHFVSDESSEPINEEYPAGQADGYDTVDSYSKNE
ncbi:hypothetical protein ABMA27_004181 [Loxostege sticticalis]|uniref:Uncharacterized protein n=1 Tax=Loxostege sticticalis TaxID=481309 RepID=A0ABR3HMM0_LOXSC